MKVRWALCGSQGISGGVWKGTSNVARRAQVLEKASTICLIRDAYLDNDEVLHGLLEMASSKTIEHTIHIAEINNNRVYNEVQENAKA